VENWSDFKESVLLNNEQAEQISEDSSGKAGEGSAGDLLDSQNSGSSNSDQPDQSDVGNEGPGNSSALEGNKIAPDDSGTVTESNSDEQNGAQPLSTEGRKDLGDQVVSTLQDKGEVTDGQDSLPKVPAESPLPDPVVVRVLKHYASEQGNSDSQPVPGQGRPLRSTDSDS